jgi:hypothetical protein
MEEFDEKGVCNNRQLCYLGNCVDRLFDCLEGFERIPRYPIDPWWRSSYFTACRSLRRNTGAISVPK